MKKMHNKIIITGGAGFVGSNLVKALISQNDKVEILVLDDFSTGNSDNLAGIDHKGLTLVGIDLSNSDDMEGLHSLVPDLKDYTLCYHLAASIGVKHIHDKPNKSLRNSMDITYNLIEIFESYNIKVIYSSTSEVYGECYTFPACEDDNLSILPTHSHRASYASSKLFTEHLLRSYDFETVIVRFFNVVGKEQIIGGGHVIPNFIKNALNGDDLIVHDDGDSVRSYCYIDDAVNMLISLAYKNVDYEAVYNIGVEENQISSLELAELIIQITNSNSLIVTKDFKEIYPNGDQIEQRFPDTTRINELLESLSMKQNCKTLTDIIKTIVTE